MLRLLIFRLYAVRKSLCDSDLGGEIFEVRLQALNHLHISGATNP